MRRQDQARRARQPSSFKEVIAAPRKHRQRIRIEHDMANQTATCGDQADGQIARRRLEPHARPEDQRRRLALAQERVGMLKRVGLAQDDRCQMRGVDLQRIGGRKQGDRPCPGARGRNCGKPRRACRGRAAGKNADMPARIFVRVGCRSRKIFMPERRHVFEAGRPNRVKHIRPDADVGDDRLAAMRPARIKQMPRFLAKEGDRGVGLERAPEHCAAVPGNAARQVDGEHRRAGCARSCPWRRRMRLQQASTGPRRTARRSQANRAAD